MIIKCIIKLWRAGKEIIGKIEQVFSPKIISVGEISVTHILELLGVISLGNILM